MRCTLRYFAILALLLLCAAGGVSWWAYEAVHEVRPFYRDAMAVQPDRLRQAGQELSSRATALVNDAQRGEPWRAQFTEDQINGWLAYDLPTKHGNLVPEDITDPRVAVEEGQVKLGARYSGGRVETVLSVDVEPYLAEPNVLGLRIVGAKAGTLPIPIGEVTDRMTRAAERFNIPLTWVQESEAPTALVTLRLKSARNGQRLRLDDVEVGADAIVLRGTAECESDGDFDSSDEVNDDGDESDNASRKPVRGESTIRPHRPKAKT